MEVIFKYAVLDERYHSDPDKAESYFATNELDEAKRVANEVCLNAVIVRNDPIDGYELVLRSNHTWYTRFANGTFAQTQFGVAGDKPAVGDFDGDGIGDMLCSDRRTTTGTSSSRASGFSFRHGARPAIFLQPVTSTATERLIRLFLGHRPDSGI